MRLSVLPVVTIFPILAILVSPLASAEESGENDTPTDRHIAFGPLGLGDSALSLDVGWLRSTVRAQIGVGFGLDLCFLGSTFLLHNGLSGQNEVYAGVRFTPVADGLFRISLEPGVGQIFIGSGIGGIKQVAVQGEVTLGIHLESYGAPYLRGVLRALRYDTAQYEGWGSDEELAAGYELTLGRFVVGTEGSLWARTNHRSIPNWRARVGIGF